MRALFLGSLALLAAICAAQDPAPANQELGVIEFAEQIIDLEDNSVEFIGNVKAVYGPSTLFADRLKVWRTGTGSGGHAEAVGNVRLEDPEGRLVARQFSFDWLKKTGKALGATLDIQGLTLKAESIDIENGVWQLSNVVASPTREGGRVYSVGARTIAIEPGNRARIQKLNFSLFGATLVRLPRYSFKLSQGEAGFTLPNVSLASGGKPRVTWRNRFELSPSSVVTAQIESSQKKLPVSELMVTKQLIPGAVSRPRSETGEPFGYGYLEDVRVLNRKQEANYFSRKRASISLATSWNQGAFGDLTESDLSKPFEIILEAGSADKSGLAMLGQIRFQTVESGAKRENMRSMLVTTLVSPEVPFSRDLKFTTRLDARAYANKNGSHGWVRPIAELTWTPNANFALGVGYVSSYESGTASFEFDRLQEPKAIHARSDLKFGPTKFSILVKARPDLKSAFDTEIYFSQVAGAIEPFVVYRQSPNKLTFGFTFRALELLDRLKVRKPSRAAKAP